MQYIFDYHDGYLNNNPAEEYREITTRQYRDIEYLKQFEGEFLFFSQNTFYMWEAHGPLNYLPSEHLDTMLATKVYHCRHGSWRELTHFFDKEIKIKLRERAEQKAIQEKQEKERQEKLRQARPPNSMLYSQINLTSACPQCKGTGETTNTEYDIYGRKLNENN